MLASSDWNKGFQELSGRATSVLKLKDRVTLQRVVLCRESAELVASSNGQMLRLVVDDTNPPLDGPHCARPRADALAPR